jgi:hypothetical protein
VGAKIFQSLETKNDFALNDFARIPDIGKPKRIFSNPRNRSAFIRVNPRLILPPEQRERGSAIAGQRPTGEAMFGPGAAGFQYFSKVCKITSQNCGAV